MKKLALGGFLVLFLHIFPSTLQAGGVGGTNLPDSVFNKMVQYVQCMAVRLSLEEADKNKYTNYLNACDCLINNCSPELNKNNNKYDIPNKTIFISDEIKNASVKSNCKNDAIKCLGIQIFTNNEELFNFIYDKKNKYAFLDSIASGLKKLMPSNYSSEKKSEGASIDPSKQEEKEDSHEENSNKYKLPILFLLILIFLIVLVIILQHYITVYLENKSKKVDTVSPNPENITENITKKEIKPVDTMSDNSTEKVSPSSYETVTNSVNEIQDLKRKVAELEKITQEKDAKIKELESKLSAASLNFSTTSASTYTKTIFLSSPIAENTFENAYASEHFIPGASIYKFNLFTETNAKFQIEDRADAFSLALSLPENNIERVCKPKNTIGSNKKVRTLQSGIAELKDNKWFVTQKATIEYVN